MTTSKPSLDLLPALTDEHVLGALIEEPRLTRAELATRTGISKPTISDSVRRLSELGLVRDTGERTTGRGRVGSYYALSATAGCGIAVTIAPDGIVAESVDVRGVSLHRATAEVPRPASSALVSAALRDAVTRVEEATPMAVRLAVVSAADPVDRATGRLVQLPDSPFLVGELDATAVLADLIDGPVLVDNDVNWAALAERAADPSPAMENFFYLYLDEGLGAAVVSDGTVSRGHSGMVGEIAHLITRGARGRAVTLTEVFDELGVRHTGSTAIDVDALTALLTAPGAAGQQARTTVASAVGGVMAAAVALVDPAVIVVGGSWGHHPVVLQAISAASAELPRPVLVRAASVTTRAPFTGVFDRVVQELRQVITRYRSNGSFVPDADRASGADSRAITPGSLSRASNRTADRP